MGLEGNLLTEKIYDAVRGIHELPPAAPLPETPAFRPLLLLPRRVPALPRRRLIAAAGESGRFNPSLTSQ